MSNTMKPSPPLRAYVVVLFGMIGLIGCSTVTEHHEKWLGVFMFDSVTAGAVLLEYDEDRPDGNTFGNIDQYNVQIDLYRYDFEKRVLKKDRNLFKGFENANIYRVVEYNPPFLLVGLNEADGTARVNLETGEKKILGIRVQHMSEDGNYFLSGADLIDAETMQVMRSANDSDYFFLHSERRESEINYVQWSQPSRLVVKRLDGDSMRAAGQILGRFNPTESISWTMRGVIKQPSAATEKISECNIDSLLSVVISCNDYPQFPPLTYTMAGSIKHKNYIYATEWGLYFCSNQDICPGD